MNKGLVSFLSILIALFLSAIYYSNTIQAPLISSLNYVKLTYRNALEYADKTIYIHTNQAKHIDELKNRLQSYENNHLVMQQLASEIDDLYKESNSSLRANPAVQLIRTISYQKSGDLNRLWVEIDDYNSSKIYGLVYQELVAGIVIPKNKKALALLNRDIMSTYAVSIGPNSAPGIAQGNNSKNILVKFIPSWINIKAGDEVKTSGLDKLFFKGLKVGRVLSTTKTQGYQNAIVEPYYQANEPNYFYIIKRVK